MIFIFMCMLKSFFIYSCGPIKYSFKKQTWPISIHYFEAVQILKLTLQMIHRYHYRYVCFVWFNFIWVETLTLQNDRYYHIYGCMNLLVIYIEI